MMPPSRSVQKEITQHLPFLRVGYNSNEELYDLPVSHGSMRNIMRHGQVLKQHANIVEGPEGT